MKKVIFIVVMAVMLAGCAEEQTKFGEGDPPAEYIEQFGNDNAARLNYVQSQDTIKLANALASLSERVTALEPEVTDGL